MPFNRFLRYRQNILSAPDIPNLGCRWPVKSLALAWWRSRRLRVDSFQVPLPMFRSFPKEIFAVECRVFRHGLQKNLELLKIFSAMAQEAVVTMRQLALAWVLSRSACIVPIPGTTLVVRLHDEIAASNVILSSEQHKNLGGPISPKKISGARYPAATQAEIDTEESNLVS